MPNEVNPNDPRILWQSQEGENMTITLDEIRHRGARFERRIWWRNFREYAAGAVVIPVFVAQLFTVHGWGLVPPVLLIAGMVYVLVQLHRHGAARPLPADAGMRASLDFHRLELERQRDALRSVWRWYLLPFVPGFAATAVASAFQRKSAGVPIAFVAFAALVLAGVWHMNQRAAQKLDRKIQELEAIEDRNE